MTICISAQQRNQTVRYEGNPFQKGTTLPIKDQRMNISQLNHFTDSIQGTQITLYEHVNRKQFIKQSIANIASIFGLKSSGLKAFGVLV
ncbi:hypothetical protein M4Z11_07325, partial [Bartonella sp. G70]|nr:hypothetical protein [Bartonella sp. G70]